MEEECLLSSRLNSLNAAIQQGDSETFNGILRSFESQVQLGLDQVSQIKINYYFLYSYSLQLATVLARAMQSVSCQ